MLTQCPGCRTSFRVSPVQLKARAGTVRCGRCAFIFNALDTLVDETSNANVDVPSLPNPLPQREREVADAVATTEAGAETAELTDYLAESPLHEAIPPTRPWPWVLGSIVAVTGLLLQGAYYYRVELAVLRPDLRPALLAACKPLHCDIPRPRSIDTLGIEASDLHPDLQQPGHLALTATLRSKAPYAQEWPLLELTLTDVADRKLAVKHFPAGDYLPKDKDSGGIIAAGFPANGEVAVNLQLDVGDLPAAGYRLYVFYP